MFCTEMTGVMGTFGASGANFCDVGEFRNHRLFYDEMLVQHHENEQEGADRGPWPAEVGVRVAWSAARLLAGAGMQAGSEIEQR